MQFCVIDWEADGLLDTVTKTYCMCYEIYSISNGVNLVDKGYFIDPQEAVDFLKEQKFIVGHNLMTYDIPLLKQLYDYEYQGFVADSLAISYYLFPNMAKHGLEAWGKILNVEKLAISDWTGLDLWKYVERCQQDVRINSKLFIHFMSYLMDIYENDLEHVLDLVEYVSFKLDCLEEQARFPLRLDKVKAEKNLRVAEEMFEDRKKMLQSVMPKNSGKLIKKKPVKMVTIKGEPTKLALAWLDYIQKNNLPLDTLEHRELPNPGSEPQLKSWLFSLGWVPELYKMNKETKKETPQVSLPFGAGLCPTVKLLYDKEPGLKALDGYYKIRHRIGLLRGFLEKASPEGYINSYAHGFTNTLRLTHSKPIANLPKVGVFFGEEIRGCLTTPDFDSDDPEYMMVGADISSLEDSTKQHYIWNYDKKYVEDMQVPGFDPHLDIGELAGLLTAEEVQFFKDVEKSEEVKKALDAAGLALYKAIKMTRGTSKQVNFSATYGAMPLKISSIAKIPLSLAEKLWEIYWQRNWAIKAIAADSFVKKVRNYKWIYNPVSHFYLFLKTEKDRFSTLNQSTGVYVFDTWVRLARKELKKIGIGISLQYHDEILLYFKKHLKDEVETILREAMVRVNALLKLNVIVRISTDYGINYADCH